MPAKTGSRNGLSYGWALGENNWNTGMDGNLTFIDRFGVHLSFKSFLNTPPGSPAAGDCHVIGTVPTGVWVGKAGQVAVYDDGAWRYGVPRIGWQAYCEAEERQYVYDGGWTPTASEWAAATVDQAEAEAGTDTTRRAWTALRVRQAMAAWWLTASSAFGRMLANVADAAAGRTALGLGSASVLAAGQADAALPTNSDIRAYYGSKFNPGVLPTFEMDFENARFSLYDAGDSGVYSTSRHFDEFAAWFGTDMQITRASTQTYFDALGNMREAPANTVRGDHDPLTGKKLGPYIGAARTNLCQYSADYTQWTATEATLEVDTWVAPDGTTARIWVAGTASVAHRLTRTVNSVSVGTSPVSASWFIYIPPGSDVQRIYMRARSAAGGYSSGQLIIIGVTGSGDNAVLTFVGSSPFGSNAPAAATASQLTVVPLGGGKFRIALTSALNTEASATSSVMDISWSPTTTEVVPGTANTRLGVWGWQYEIGGSPGPYIPVPTDAAVVRAATTITVSGTKFSGVFNTEQGSVALRYAKGIRSAGAVVSAAFTDGTSSNRIQFVVNSSAATAHDYAEILKDLVYQAQLGASSTVSNSGCLSYAKDNVQYAKLGVLATDGSATIPTVDRLCIGHLNGVLQFDGHLTYFAYYPVALSGAQTTEISK